MNSIQNILSAIGNMAPIEIVLFVTGIILAISGYTYYKIKVPKKKKTIIPSDYTEHVGICKKHSTKDGKYFEIFEIIHDGKTIEHSLPPQDNKQKLAPVGAIDKFYIKNGESGTIKRLIDFENTSSKKSSASTKTLNLCRGLMGAGLIMIITTLMLVIF